MENECKHQWIRRSDNWKIFRCDKCKVLGYFMKRGKRAFKIIPYICKKYKCKKFATKINGVGDRYCDEHYVDKQQKEWAMWAADHGNIRHEPVNPEIYYEKFTGKK